MFPSLVRRLAAGALAVSVAVFLPGTSLAETAIPLEKGLREGLGEPAVTRTAALETLRRHFAVPEESASVFIEGHLNRYPGQFAWEFWVYTDGGPGPGGYPLGTVDALTGEVLRYSADSGAGRPIPLGPLDAMRSKDDAELKAWNKVRALYPKLELAPGPSPEDGRFLPGAAVSENYRFTYVQQHGRIPVMGSQVTVELDPFTLDIVSLEAHFLKNARFPARGPAIRQVEAQAMFGQRIKAQLFYQPAGFPYDTAAEKDASLVYRFANSYAALDAVTGVFQDVEPDGDEDGASEPVPAGTVTPVAAASLPLTEETGRAFAASILGVDADSLVLQEMPEDVPAGMLFFIGPEGTVGLAQETGSILFADRSNPDGIWDMDTWPAEPAPLSPAEAAAARNAAFEAVQRYFSDYRADLRLEPYGAMWAGPIQYFHFQRYHKGVPVGVDGVDVSINMQTMSWQSMSAYWTSETLLPDPAGAIPADKAVTLFLERNVPKLVYRPVYRDLPFEKELPVDPEAPVEMELVYTLTDVLGRDLMDALTGEPVRLGLWSEPVTGEHLQQLAGHWAEEQLRYMVRNGALDARDLSPEGALTHRQGADMIMAVSWMGFRGRTAWFSTETADLPVTRAQMAVWAAEALGLGALARSELSAQAGFADLAGLSAAEQNAAAFLQALGLLGPGTAFRGHDAMTQAEGATLAARLYNYLLEESPPQGWGSQELLLGGFEF
ncbi:MAG TPA: hypothetical protein VD902_02870 [Symbiobacteriaceae bacterium]|nr:hypothetical protein [Symbiobacteriaceae bacterium]